MSSTEARKPADQAARDRIRTALGETLFVEAGAGTGKTTALVSRIVALVADGVPIGSIAAITFTEAAAAELRDRVRAELQKVAVSDDAKAPRCEAALGGLDAAAIQTLHGFARRILAFYPLEAGLPPRFEVRDQVQADIAFEDRWLEFLAALFSDTESGPRLPRALALGLTAAHLRNIARALHANFDRLEPIPALTAAPVAINTRPVLDALGEALKMRSLCTNPDDKLFRRLEELVDIHDRLVSLTASLAAETESVARTIAEQDLLSLLVAMPTLTAGNDGQAKSWGTGGTECKKSIGELLGNARDELQSLLDAVRSDCIESVLPRLVEWTLEGAEQRRQDGVLEYHDLLVLAVRMLRSSTPVREALHRRFTHLLIDEFQDTDPLQVELATLLATIASEVGDLPWQELPVEAGSLFFVGDPRQSIYRFRRADIELYEAAKEAFAPQPVHLTANFRSRRQIISWVNGVFGDIFERPYGITPETPLQAEYTPLTAYLKGDAPVVHVIGGPQPKGEKMGAIRAIEAAEIAALIRAAREDNWLRKSPHHTSTCYSDVTILIPGRNALPALERALEAADIPFRIEGATLLFGTQEVRDFTNILAAIDDPSDEVAVIAALRSPAFACADDELYAFRQLRPRRTWDYTTAIPEDVPAQSPVRMAMEALHELYDRRSWLPIAGLVETIIRGRRLFELAFANSRPRDTWQRIRFLHEHARRFDAAGNATLRHFVAWLRDRAKNGAQLTESVVPDPNDDAVRIMTVHAAKGLEFPIVFVAGLLNEADNRPPPILFDRGHAGPGSPEASVGRAGGYFRTAGYASLFEREKVMERLERDRLLYVAATRARECLVISAFHQGHTSHDKRHCEAKCTLAECIHAACGRNAELRGQAPVAASPMPPVSPPPEGAPPDLAKREHWLEARMALIRENARPEAMAATAIAHAGEEKPEASADEQSPWRRGRAGTAVGRAVHAVLQTIDHATLQGLDDAARAQAAAEGIPGREAEVAALVRSACESLPVREALASGRSWRELYVATPITTEEGSVLVEGFIDLLYATTEGYVIVDYKTDAVRTDAEVEAAMQRYRLQGAAYALAVETQLNEPVTRFACVFVRQNAPARVQTIERDELRTTIGDVRARIAALQRDPGESATSALPA
jgi:ATP-dependent helicase/nuclease subunit A